MEACTGRKEEILLYLYDELSEQERVRLSAHIETCAACKALLEEEQALQAVLDCRRSVQPSQSFMEACRSSLRARLRQAVPERRSQIWTRLSRWWTPLPALGLQAAVVLLVFVGGWIAGQRGGKQRLDISPAVEIATYPPFQSSTTEPPQIVYLDVRPLDPQQGEVMLTFQSLSRHALTGTIQDEPIRQILTWAIEQDVNAGSKLQAIDLLGKRPDEEVKRALVDALRNDGNPGVRLEAMNVLKTMVDDEMVRRALLDALREDPNPGIRIEAIHAVAGFQDEPTRWTLQEVTQREQNEYVKTQAHRLLLQQTPNDWK